MIATAGTVAIIVFSCKGKISETEKPHVDAPAQIVDSMFLVQTQKGKLQMRVEADVMERYENDTSSYELFPKGIHVFSYDEEGMLETVLHSDNAKHFKNKKNNEELWSAFGNVVVQNVIKQQTLESDTLYWDQKKKEIFTDCYVKMYSSEGFIQGYGMRSDEKARNVNIYTPFDSDVVVVQDTTKVMVDSVNFIGPLLKK